MRFASVFAGLAAVSSAICAVSAAVVAAPLETRAQAAVYKSCKNAKQVAITFDDGPYIWDEELLATLAKYKAKATFYVNGNNWRCIYDDERIAAMRKLFAAGHEFSSHTWSHKNLTTLTWDKLHNEMWKVEEALIRILGVNPAIMRPPYGSYNSTVLSAVAQRNQSVAIWDFDSGDTTGKTAQQSKDLYKAAAAKKPNNILTLNHSISNSTVHDVIPYALQLLNSTGYQFVTVSTCLGIKPYQQVLKQGVKDPKTWKC